MSEPRHLWLLGASSGIGRALAVKLAAEGAIMALSARRADDLEALNSELGGGHLVLPLDVTKPEALTDAVARLQQAWPRIDGMFYFPGIYDPQRLDKLTMEHLRDLIEINLLGAFRAVMAVLPVMKRQRSGQIVLCGSVAGYRGLPNGQPYCASKAAMISLAESLRAENGPEGIDVRLISPGFVKTRLTEKNPFPMPFAVTPEQATESIVKGLKGSAFEIHFPKIFSLQVKLLRFLPDKIFFLIARRLV